MKNVKIKGLAIILCAVTMLSGCKKVQTKYAFFVYDGADTFISELMDYMTGHVPDNAGYAVRDAGNSQSVQNRQIVELMEDGFGVFIINAVDRLACSAIVEKCEKKGLPVIFFNREPLEGALNGSQVFYVGAAADSLGEKQADMVAELFGDFTGTAYDRSGDGVIQLCIIKGEQGHQDAEKRTERCVNRLKELGYQVEVLATLVADWRRHDGQEAMRQLYGQFGDRIELIFANNDDMALGAIDYLTAAGIFAETPDGYGQPFVLVGVDGTKAGLEAVDKGLLYGTVNNDSAKQADAILLLARYIMDGESLENFPYPMTNGHYIYIDGDIITRNNKTTTGDVK